MTTKPIEVGLCTLFFVFGTSITIVAMDTNSTTEATTTEPTTAATTTDTPPFYQGPQYTINCLESGNVEVKGVSESTSLTIVDGGTTCVNNNSTFNETNGKIVIASSCLSSENFTDIRNVTFTIHESTFDEKFIVSPHTADGLKGRQNLHRITVNCKPLPKSGMNVYVVHGVILATPEPNIPTEIQKVEMRLKSEKYDSYKDVTELPDVSTVYIGDKFYMYLVYLGKNQYSVIPTECKAFEGAYASEPSSSVQKLDLYNASCLSQRARDYRLMQPFHVLMVNETRIVSAEMYGFMFISNNEITFVCTVNICNGDNCRLPAHCDDWPSRRRRSAIQDKQYTITRRLHVQRKTVQNSAGNSSTATPSSTITPSMTIQPSVAKILSSITTPSVHNYVTSSTASPQGNSSTAIPSLTITPSMTTQPSVAKILSSITTSSVHNYVTSSTASPQGIQSPSTKQPDIHEGPRYTFGCLENGNVVVKGVSPGTNITVVGDQCKNKTQTSSGSSITIEAICLSSQIFTSNRTVTFTIKDEVFDGNRSVPKPPLLVNGGQNSHVFTVNCQSLTDRGMNVYIVHGMGVINSATVRIPTEIETVRMRIKSDVYSTRNDVTDLPDMSSVYIGDKFYLYLVYNGKDKYKIVPTKCTAFEGAYAAEPASSVSNVLLWTRDSCISDQAIAYRLMHNFKTMSSDSRVVYAEMFGFQFHSSTEITFVCEVKICKPGDGSNDCVLKSDQTCRNNTKWTARRRRRQFNDDGGFKVIGKIQVERQFTDPRLTRDNSAGVLQINWVYLIATYIFLQIKWYII